MSENVRFNWPVNDGRCSELCHPLQMMLYGLGPTARQVIRGCVTRRCAAFMKESPGGGGACGGSRLPRRGCRGSLSCGLSFERIQ